MTGVMVMAAVALAAVAAFVERRVAREHARRLLAEGLGFVYQRGLLTQGTMRGHRDGVPIVVEWGAHDERSTTTVRVRCVAFLEATRRAGRSGVDTGDPELDAEVAVSGPPREVAARLDAETRLGVRRVVDSGGAIALGWLEWRFLGHIHAAAEVGAAIDAAVDLARRLEVPNVDARLRTVALADPLPGVRWRALHALGDSATGRSTARQLRSDPDEAVRLVAAMALGEPIVDVDPAALAAVTARDPARVVAALTGDEAALCRLLDAEVDTVRIAACEALGRVGTARSVEALRACTGLLPTRTSTAATAALARVRERLGDVEPGRLAVVDGPEAGRLAVAPRDGALAVAEPAPRETPWSSSGS